MKLILTPVLFLSVVFTYSCGSSEQKVEVKKIDDTIVTETPLPEPDTTHYETEEEKKEDSLRKPGDTKIIFPEYSVLIHDFKIYDRFDENGKLKYDIDSKEVTFNSHEGKTVALTMLQDTFHTSNNTNSSFFENKIEIIPHHKDDQFKIDFSYQVVVYQMDDAAFTNNDPKKEKVFARWYGMTDYTTLKDSIGYFFVMPNGVYDDSFLTNDVKKKIHLRDTSIIYHREYEEVAKVIYKGKPCGINANATYLRIKRFNQNKLLETKFIRIDRPYID
jgi:hypothetical protein